MSKRENAWKKMNLHREVRVSMKLIRLGFKELQTISFINDFYFLPFLLLSTGFERLMKCMLCYKHHTVTGQYPTVKELRKQGHDLMELRKAVISECISMTKVNSIPVLKTDYDFLTADKDLDSLLEILSEFGKGSRYYNLNVVTGKTTTSDTERKWQSFEAEIKKRKKIKLNAKNQETLDKEYKLIEIEIIIILEKFTSALVRQFTKGDLGSDAGTNIYEIDPFYKLMDDDFGKTNYSELV